jgi:hypothetical protein
MGLQTLLVSHTSYLPSELEVYLRHSEGLLSLNRLFARSRADSKRQKLVGVEDEVGILEAEL